MQRILTTAVILIAATGLAGCGGAHSAVVARVGATDITKAALVHWTSVLAREQAPDPGPNLRQQALQLLISSQWLIGEAAREGMKVSEQEVERHFKQSNSELFRNGEEGFKQFLSDTGQTAADLKFRIEVELALAAIGRRLTEREAKLGQAAALAYYNGHLNSFIAPEKRYFEIVNRTTKAAALAAKAEIEGGKSIASMSLTEFREPHGAEEIEKAIYKTRPNVLRGPYLSVDAYWSLFEITRIVPTSHKPFSQVRATIETQLAAEQRTRTLSQFNAAWRARWIAQTDCAPGFVVQKCRQYKVTGATPQEEPLAFD